MTQKSALAWDFRKEPGFSTFSVRYGEGHGTYDIHVFGSSLWAYRCDEGSAWEEDNLPPEEFDFCKQRGEWIREWTGAAGTLEDNLIKQIEDELTRLGWTCPNLYWWA